MHSRFESQRRSASGNHDRARFAGLVLAGLGAASLAAAQTSPGQPGAPPAANTQPAPPATRPGGPAGASSSRDESSVSFGLLAGGQLRDWFSSVQNGSTSFADNSGRFLIGPTLQFHWPRFTLEVDALRRGFGARSSGSILGLGFSNQSNGSAWEFPVLLKRKFRMSGMAKTFLGTGVAIRYLIQDATLAASGNPANQVQSSDRNVTFGIPLAAGVEFKVLRFRVTPELRYTLWTADKSFAPVRSSGSYDPNHNQVGLLFGFTF